MLSPLNNGRQSELLVITKAQKSGHDTETILHMWCGVKFKR